MEECLEEFRYLLLRMLETHLLGYSDPFITKNTSYHTPDFINNSKSRSGILPDVSCEYKME